MTDLTAWNDKLYYGTTDHGTCEDKGEVYEYTPGEFPKLIGDFNYFRQQGMGYVRQGNNHIIVPGIDPPADNYELFVYDGLWNKQSILPDSGGHLVDVAHFKGNYYVVTNAGLVVVKNSTDYKKRPQVYSGNYLQFETESSEQELGQAQPTSLTVWNNGLYLAGQTQDCDPKTDPNCQIQNVVWKYDGVGNVKEYNAIPYDINFGISKDFKNSLYVKGVGGGLYKTEDGLNFVPIEFFTDFIPSPGQESRVISDIVVLDDKMYVSVMVGTFGNLASLPCNTPTGFFNNIFGGKNFENLPVHIVTGYEIYSSRDGVNWNKVYSKSVFVKNYPEVNLPMEVLNGKLYLGVADSQVQGDVLNQFTSLYVYDPMVPFGSGKDFITGKAVFDGYAVADTTKLGVPPSNVKLASEITDISAQNIIAIGNPCDNPIVGNFISCAEWEYQKGQAMIQLFPNGDNLALVIAGTTVEDTQRAATVLARWEKYALQGDNICVTGTSLSDISVSEGSCRAASKEILIKGIEHQQHQAHIY